MKYKILINNKILCCVSSLKIARQVKKDVSWTGSKIEIIKL